MRVFYRATIDCLSVPDIMPKRSAAAFWVSFPGSHQNQYSNDAQSAFLSLYEQRPLHTDSFDPLSLVNVAIRDWGGEVTRALMFGIGGNAARSELDALAELLRKLIVTLPDVKFWLQSDLFSNGFPSQLVKEHDKLIFLKKVLR